MMNKNYTFVFGILLLVLTLSFISAAPPVTTVQQFPEGFVIVDTQWNELILNQDFLYTLFVYNSSNGKLLNNTEVDYCRFFLADSQGYNIFAGNMSYESFGGWAIELNGSNFSKLGFYNYGVNCMDNQGGELHGIFEVTPGGTSLSEGLSLLLIGILIIILTLLILTIRAMILVDNFGWNFGFLNIAYLLLNVFFYTSWKVFSIFLYHIPTVGATLHSLWTISNIIWIPFILGQVFYILTKITEESQVKRLVKMGYTQDEASSRVKRRK